MGEVVGGRAIENAAIDWVIGLERAAGRSPVDTRHVAAAPADIESPPRVIEVKAYGGTARGNDLWLEARQVEEARANPGFFLYVVENVRQGDPAMFRLKVVGGKALQRLIARARERRYFEVPWPVADYDALPDGLDRERIVPRQNRVTPFGELVAVSDRGMFMGNRGVLHDAGGRIVRHHQGRRWICCLTEFKGRRRAVMRPGFYTELFFLDEATALSAGHRPCVECRRADAMRFRAAWTDANGHDPGLTFAEVDRFLREEPGAWRTGGEALPDGAMAVLDGGAHLVVGGCLRPWGTAGYGPVRPMPDAVEVLTPRSITAAIAAGYAPVLHPSARG